MNLHQRALELVKEYQRVEAELIEILRKIDDRKLYREHGATSLFVYATKVLGLTESVAWNFITVSRATKKYPALNQAIQNGELSVSKARRITSVLTFENQDEWIQKAKTLSQRNLEKAVVKENPRAVTPDRASYITEDFMKLEIGLTEQEFEEIKSVQDLVCQSKQNASSLKDTILEAIRFYRQHKDPVEKAKRAKSPKPDSSQAKQEDQLANQKNQSPKTRGNVYPAALTHELILRDGNQCTDKNPDGTRCESRRWLDFHHLIPRSQDGTNTLENLVTICRAHHQLHHIKIQQPALTSLSL